MSKYVLVHHGIKGMHWGIRRFQNEDGSLTNAGKQRYQVDIEGAKEKVQKANEDVKKAISDYYKAPYKEEKKYAKKLHKAVNNANYAKEDYRAEKIKQRLNSEKHLSEHRKNLEKQYRDKGMSEEEAAVAAYKRDRTEKILKTAAVIGIAAAASYVAYKHYDDTVDRYIKSDTILKRVASNNDKSVHDAFYAVLGNSKMDEKKYIGLYGNHIKNRIGSDVYQKTIKVNDAIKVASEKSGQRELAELVKTNSAYRHQLEKALINRSAMLAPFNSTLEQKRTVDKAISALREGKVDKYVYRALNFNLADHSAQTTQEFYKHLASKGYGAVMDMNDKKLSGYMTKTPMIVFDSSKTVVDSVRKVGEEEIKKANTLGMMDLTIRTLTPTVITTSAVGAAAAGYNHISKTKQNDLIVKRYRKKHPNTTMSYNEILRSQKK